MSKWIRKIFNYCVRLAKSKYALLSLGIFSFFEAIIIPIPNEILLIPICLFSPKKAYEAAFITTIASVAGALAAYFIGYMVYTYFGISILENYGFAGEFANFTNLYDKYGVWVVIIGAVTPVPFKLVTLFSGFLKSNLIIFTVFTFLARGVRFFIIAWLLKKYGKPARKFINKRLDWIFMGVCAIILLLVLWIVL
ncbi:MAG: DedA family protein [Rickettsiales bacterium]|jgi:membrane protein YqaA with SNARE-associated domain|nr:DedA family protein [Rickettsiales bacterium]